MRASTRLVGVATGGGLVVFLLGCGASGDRPGVAILPDMAASVPYDAFDRNPLTGGGPMLPPEGAVPVGFEPFRYGPEPEEAERAGRELVNPLPATAANLARGAAEYGNKCQVCHGPSGDGDGPIIGRFPNPPSLKADHARGLRDGQIYHIISRGQGIMPSHAVQVLPEDRWRLVHHVRRLQGIEPGAAAGGAPEEVRDAN